MTSQPGTFPSGLAALANGAVLSPFTQLRRLLGASPAGHADPIDLTIGEPREPMPPFVVERLIEAVSGYANYPPIRGTDRTARRHLGMVGTPLRRRPPRSTPSAKFCR